MKDDFLFYYNNELTFLRHMGAEFAKSHPKIAGRLGLSERESEDPNVARLMEAFAFLTARIHRKLDDELPEFADALLNTVFPHYQLPIPAFSILQYSLNPEATASIHIEKGTQVETHPSYEKTCRFITCYDTELYPISIKHVRFSEKMAIFPQGYPKLKQTKATINIRLSSFNSSLTFSKMAPPKLRFYINLNSPYSYKFYEMIFNNALCVVLRRSPDDTQPIVLDETCLSPVGFEQDDGLFPYPAQSFLGYRLLTEFFVFPHKYMFFDLLLPSDIASLNFGETLDIIIYLNSSESEFISILTSNSLLLGCTPLTNLFEIQAEPILINHFASRYLIIPDARQFDDMEVYQIQDVQLQTTSGTAKPCFPLYGLKVGLDPSSTTFWSLANEKADIDGDATGKRNVLISFTHPEFDPQQGPDYIAQLKLWCTNHDIPYNLPYGGNEPRLQMVKGEFQGGIHCLLPFTPSYRLPMRKKIRWQLISHLALNNLSFENDPTPHILLQEILHLYNFHDSEHNNLLIDAIEFMEINPTIFRCSEHYGNAVYRGTEMILSFKDTDLPNLFLFSSILEKFLGMYTSINSFTQLTVRYSKHSKELVRWQPRAGSQTLL